MKHSLKLVVAAIFAAPAIAEPAFDAMFQDHAVLQRDVPVAIWGVADPGEAVTIRWGDAEVAAKADRKGEWKAELPPRPAGHRGDLSVTGDHDESTQTLRDVVAGDVWLCSGQSNMEMEVERSLNSRAELQDADQPDIRLFQIGHAAAPTPQKDFAERPFWRLANAESVAGFSAVCFFMAKELRKTRKVPMGLIHASWGGTAINTWRSGAALSAEPATKADMALLTTYAADAPKAERLWGERWASWWAGVDKSKPWTAPLVDAKPVPKLVNWERWGSSELEGYDGQIWLQAQISLTAEQAANAKTLDLGTIDDLDQSWVNGIAVGNTFGLWRDRSYALGKSVLRAGVNLVTVHVTDKWGRAGGLTGDPDKIGIKLADGGLIPLKDWTYRIEPNSKTPLPAPWETHWGLSTVGNAMIAPVQQYTIKGVAWYQGESDVGSNPPYRQKLAGLMRDWRAGFAKPDLPFLIVQLSDFGPVGSAPFDSGWAAQREEQRQAVLADRKAALVITRDLGERYDIHPTNKQMVGKRLATAARAVAYGEKIAPSGPEISEARQIGDELAVRFRNVGGGLVSYSSDRAIGFEICSDSRPCEYAEAKPQGDVVEIAVPAGFVPSRVRYCWADSSICNLFDRSDNPVGPFEIPVTR